MMNEDQRMLAGKLSNPRDPELLARQRWPIGWSNNITTPLTMNARSGLIY